MIRGRGGIWLKTGVVVGVYAVAIWIVYRQLLAGTVGSVVLALVVAFIVVQSAAIALLLGGLSVAKLVASARERRMRRLEPIVRERMVTFLTADDGGEVETARAAIEQEWARSPRVVERCADDLLASIGGSERSRFSSLAEEIGLVDRWVRRARSAWVERRRRAISRLSQLDGGRGDDVLRDALRDPEPAVRIEAARALLRSEKIAEIERVFEVATREPLLVRAVLVEKLRPHAGHLAGQAIPRALDPSDPRRAAVTLEMIEAWQKSLPVPAVAPLLRHPRPEIRARALRSLPYVLVDLDTEREVRTGLSDRSDAVRIAAVRVAGKLGLETLVPELERLLHARDRRIAVGAAYALAELDEAGREALERRVRENHATASSAALEALERLRTGRLALARV
ncbi:MAG: hypothetical protein R3199_01540 [Gemmatimonadota bacterium]|nr:hypothetical protein [Gemmatimonadota bacterium]